MEEFDLLAHTLNPAATLIEASAGTGKTYNIQHLYLRFIVERSLTPDKLLVVTFSNEATAELKLRISENLLQAETLLLKYFAPAPVAIDESSFDPTLFDILGRAIAIDSYPEVLRKVQFAYMAMDEAAVLTIHKFCLGVLTEFAFESGALFGLELVENKSSLFADLVGDFLKQEVAYRQDFLGVLYREFISKEFLDKIADKVYGKDDVVVLGAAAELPDIAGIYASIQLEDIVTIRKKLVLKKRAKLYPLFELLENVKKPDDRELLNFIKIINSSDFNPILKAAYFTKELPDTIQQAIISVRGFADRVSAVIYMKFVGYLEKCFNSLENMSDKISVGFDDILYMTRTAIKRQGSKLKSAMAQAYSAVLVDEFQDTSGVQFDIFNTLFGNNKVPFFMIGDPKQSIYAFRDADIFSYLKAVASEGVIRSTLSKNFRSTPEYIAAMNLLFANRESAEDKVALPFIFNEIQYINIEAGRTDNKRLFIGDESLPLEFRWLSTESEISLERAERMVIKSVADDIAKTLSLSLNKQAYFTDGRQKEVLSPADFAVLVEKNYQGEEIRKELNRRGIVGVVLKSGNVFNSPEALELGIILRAILNSRSESAVMAALCTRCFRYSPQEIEKLREDNIELHEYWFDFFAQLNATFRHSGFLQAFSAFFERDHLPARHHSSKAVLATCENGERAISNYLQLVELLEKELLARGCADAVVIDILHERMCRESSNEEYEMRLESDEDAVKIMTVHKSKGLQFPVVYVPFLYSGLKKLDKLDAPITCNVAGEKSIGLIVSAQELGVRREQIRREARAEQMRLFYVALTRAEDKCIVYGGNIKGISDSALGDVLGRDFSRLGILGDSEYIQVSEGWDDSNTVYRAVTDVPELGCEKFAGRIERDWGVMSYSSLVSHDFVSFDVRSDAILSDAGAEAGVIDIIDNLAPLPSSNKVGSAVHEVIEETNLSNLADNFAGEAVLKKLCKYGITGSGATIETASAEIAGVKKMLTVLAAAPLVDSAGVAFTLADVPVEKQRSEMSFYFSVREKISTNSLADFFDKRGLARYRGDTELKSVLANLGLSMQSRGFREGFLFGLIDLVFEYKGKFYFADWKTNDLSRYGGYTPAAVLASMGESGYLLQFYIYTVALNLFLRSRIRDFDYSRHFGGGYYLYLRGLDVSQPDHGVFYESPSEQDVAELIRIFTGDSYEF